MKIRELLDGPGKWTQGAYARDASGSAANPDDPAADRWCLLGALFRCYPAHLPDEETGYLKAYDRIANLVWSRYGAGVPDWNDATGRTFDEVRKLIEELDV